MQTITYMKQAQRRMRENPDQRSKSKQMRKNKMNATVDNISLNQFSMFNPAEQNLEEMSMRFSISPSEMPFIAETFSQGVQADLMDVKEVTQKQKRIQELETEL